METKKTQDFNIGDVDSLLARELIWMETALGIPHTILFGESLYSLENSFEWKQWVGGGVGYSSILSTR